MRKLSVEMQYLEQSAETLQQRLSMLNAAITDLTYASMTLEGLEAQKENDEMLVPIGGSSYVKMKLMNCDKVVLGIGSGVSLEKTLPEAKTMIKERLDELEKSADAAQNQFQQIAERINTGRTRLQTLLSSAREGKAANNV